MRTTCELMERLRHEETVKRMTYDPGRLDDPASFRVKFFSWLAEEGRVGCGQEGPGDPSVGIHSERCEPDLEEIQIEPCGCATARYWCRHGHSWADLQCKEHAPASIEAEMNEWEARR